MEAALAAWPGLRVEVVGHSLGAGIAACLGLLWRDCFDVHVTAFAVPPCVCADLADASERVVTAVVYGDDVVPRLSVANMRRRKESLLTDLPSTVSCTRCKSRSVNSSGSSWNPIGT